jgi:hypothetical protein
MCQKYFYHIFRPQKNEPRFVDTPCLTNPVFNAEQYQDLLRIELGRLQSEQRSRMCALFDYGAAQADELSFRAGDVIKLVEETDAEWWTGELDGKRGLFPVSYVEQECVTSEFISRAECMFHGVPTLRREHVEQCFNEIVLSLTPPGSKKKTRSQRHENRSVFF